MDRSPSYMLLLMVPKQVRDCHCYSVIHTANFIVPVQILSFCMFLHPGSSVLIWKSFFDLSRSFSPCPGFLKSESVHFSVLMRVIQHSHRPL